MNPKPWTIKAKGDKEVEILLYEQIGKDWWNGDGTTAKAFAEDLKAAGDVDKISLRINSPGGDVFDGLAIFNTLLAHKAKVTAYIDGIAASIASVIAMAGDEIVMGTSSMLMIHNPWTMAVGDANEMRRMADTLDKVGGSMIPAYKRHAKMEDSEIKSLMDEETWMTAEDAKAKGFATSIVDVQPMAASISPELFAKFRNAPAALGKKPVAAVQVPAVPAKISASLEKKKMEPTVENVVVDNYHETAAEIFSLGEKLGTPSEVIKSLLAKKASLGAAKDVCYDLYQKEVQEKAAKLAVTSGVAQPTIAALTPAERQSYSIARAIRSMSGEPGAEATMEREISDNIAKVLGRSTPGMFVPTRLNAALDTRTGGAGGFTVEPQLGDLIELLRNRMLVRTLGATVLTGLTGPLTFPVRLTGSTTSWVGQNPGTDVADTDATFGAKTMSPKTLQGTSAFSRQVLQQSTVDVESLIRNDLATAHALAIDLAAINGSGLSNQPLGLLKTTGIGDVALGATGAAPVYADIVNLEKVLANANADTASMKFLTTPTMRAKLRKTQQFATTNGVPIWQQLGNSLGVGDVLGYPGYVSNQVPSTLVKSSSIDCHAIIFGDWSQVLIGEWGVIELVVDPYRLKKQGLIEVTSFQMVDIALRQPAAIAAIQDARDI